MRALDSFREFLFLSEKNGLLKRFSSPLSPEFECAYLMRCYDGKETLVFENIEGYNDLKIAAGVYNTRQKIALGLGVSVKELLSKITDAIRCPGLEIEEADLEEAPVREIIAKGPNIRQELPVLRHYEQETHPYMTSSVVICKDPRNGRINASYHRIKVLSDKKLTLRLVEGRTLYNFHKMAEETDQPLEVAVVIGLDPPAAIASAISAGNISEFGIASALLGKPYEMTPGITVDLPVPANAEIVLEGIILPHERAKEGPFVELGGVDIIRDQPIMEVSLLSMRENAFYQALLPAGKEHQLLQGMPCESTIFEAAKKHAKIVGVNMTPGGAGWLEVAIAIEKNHPYIPKVVAMAAIHAHSSLKTVIVVDEDVDIYDYEELYKTILQRANPSTDLLIVEGIRGSSLDHSNLRVEGERVVELPPSKLIIDATIKGPKELFQKATIPLTENVKKIVFMDKEESSS